VSEVYKNSLHGKLLQMKVGEEEQVTNGDGRFTHR